jgi:hypothetical protein
MGRRVAGEHLVSGGRSKNYPGKILEARYRPARKPEGRLLVRGPGLCRGVCTWAGEAARAAGFEVRLFAPDLAGIQSHGDMVERYYRRNRQLIAACDIVHAFISKEDGFKGGTKYEVQYAKRLGKEVVLHREGGKVQRMPSQTSFFAPPESDFPRAG